MSGAEERTAGYAEAYFWINGPQGMRKYYLGDSVPMDPNQPIMGRLEYHLPYQAVRGQQVIRENIFDTRSMVDIRRYFGVGPAVFVQNATPGDTGYWPIGLSECVQNNSATWPNH